jgi:hypothetical protein
MRYLILAGCILVYGYAAQGAWSSDPDYRRPFPLPQCPPGCVIVLYGPLPKGMMGLKAEGMTDWKNILIAHGVKFPDKGFALFYRPGRMLAIATDTRNQDLVQILME